MSEKRICRNCGDPIPWRMQVEGVVKFMPNRKFCLKCSPWRGHNTKKDINSVPRGKLPWKDLPEEKKQQIQSVNYTRGVERKNKLIKLAGGKCTKCGYNKNPKALTFHHLRDKKFQLAINSLASRNWDEILDEFKKCELVCMNCHMEEGNGIHESRQSPIKAH